MIVALLIFKTFSIIVAHVWKPAVLTALTPNEIRISQIYTDATTEIRRKKRKSGNISFFRPWWWAGGSFDSPFRFAITGKKETEGGRKHIKYLDMTAESMWEMEVDLIYGFAHTSISLLRILALSKQQLKFPLFFLFFSPILFSRFVS